MIASVKDVGKYLDEFYLLDYVPGAVFIDTIQDEWEFIYQFALDLIAKADETNMRCLDGEVTYYNSLTQIVSDLNIIFGENGYYTKKEEQKKRREASIDLLSESIKKAMNDVKDDSTYYGGIFKGWNE